MSLMLNNLIGFGAAPAPSGSGATLSYQGTGTDETDTSTYTFSSQAIGSASATRHVIVCINWVRVSPSTTVSSVTIGGVSATISVQVNSAEAAGGVWGSAIVIAAVPTGTTADVVVTFGATAARCAISTWAAYDLLSSTATNTYTDVDSTLSQSVNVSAGGIAVACCNRYNSSGGVATWTWAGLTEGSDAQLASGAGQSYSSSGAAFASAQTGLTVSATASGGTGDANSMAVAAFA